MAQSALFCRGGFRLGGSLLVAVASTTACLLSGCDTDTGKTDKQVIAQMDHATRQMSGTEADWTLANKELGDAARATTASLPRQLQAKSLLADSELQMAQLLAKQVLGNDAEIDRLAREIGVLSGEIQSNNQMVVELAAYDPAKLTDAVTKKTAELAGTDDSSVWSPLESSDLKLDASTAVKSKSDKLTAEIADLTTDIKTKSDQRNTLLDQADKLTQQSQREAKDKSVGMYVEGSSDRKQAADLSVEIEKQTALLGSKQADLALLQTQQNALSDAQSKLTERAGNLVTNWIAVQGQQAMITQASAKLLGVDPVKAPTVDKNGDLKTDPTIGSKAAALAALAKTNHDVRAMAETHFNSAIGFYKESAELATRIQQALGEKTSKADPEKPDQLAWSEEQKALDVNSYRFLQADAEMQRGDFFARSVSEARRRLELMARVGGVLKAATLISFPSLEDPEKAIDGQLQKALASAREAYGNSAELLSGIAEGSGTAGEKASAQVEDIFAQYGWYLLEIDGGDAQKASEHLALAKTAVTAAVSSGAPLPTLPPELMASALPGLPGAGGSTNLAPAPRPGAR